MKTLTTKSGQIFEITHSQKEFRDFSCAYWNRQHGYPLDEDTFLYILYKDGSSYYLSYDAEEGVFKSYNILGMMESNAATYVIYGSFRIYNMDDIEEEYCESVDEDNKSWNVDIPK